MRVGGLPQRAYRVGADSDETFTPRPAPRPEDWWKADDTVGEKRGLSVFTSLEALRRVFKKPGKQIQVIDLSQLKEPLRCKDHGDGHVSIVPVDLKTGEIDNGKLKAWADCRTTGKTHPFTQIVRDATIPSEDLRT